MEEATAATVVCAVIALVAICSLWALRGARPPNVLRDAVMKLLQDAEWSHWSESGSRSPCIKLSITTNAVCDI